MELCSVLKDQIVNTKRAMFVNEASKESGLSLLKKPLNEGYQINAKPQTIKDTLPNQNTVFPKGEKMSNPNLTGTAWMKVWVAGDSTFDSQIANVTFEPTAELIGMRIRLYKYCWLQ